MGRVAWFTWFLRPEAGLRGVLGRGVDGLGEAEDGEERGEADLGKRSASVVSRKRRAGERRTALTDKT